MNASNARRLAALIASVLIVAGCQSSTPDGSPVASLASEPAASAPSQAGPSPSDSPSATAAPEVEDEGILQVLVNDLRLRAAPSTESGALAGLSAGQLIRATGNSEVRDGIAWVEVVQQPSDRTGWVASAGSDGSPWLAVVRDGSIGVASGADAELIDPGSGERSPLTLGMSIFDLAFAPDGESLGIIDYYDGARILALDAAPFTASPSPTPSGPSFGPPVRTYLAFSPDGEALAYLEGQNLLALMLVWLGEGAAPTFSLPYTLHPVSWSPDSRRLLGAEWVNVATGEPENWEIVVAEEGEAGATRLTDFAGVDIHPAWSPDGSTIAFLREGSAGTVVLALMGADGSDQRTLVTFVGTALSAARPSWSPDGSRIAFGGGEMILLADSHTGEQLSVDAPAERCDDLTWSPTGASIAFVCGPADQSAPSIAYVTSLTDLEVTELGPASRLDWARSLDPMD